MFRPLIAASYLFRRAMTTAAILAAILATGGTSARAQSILYENEFIEVNSTDGEYELVWFTESFVSPTEWITVYFDASTTSGSPNYYSHLYLYDWTEGQYVYQNITEQIGVYDRAYGNELYVIPGHTYSVLLYASNAQVEPRRWFYSNYIEVYEN